MQKVRFMVFPDITYVHNMEVENEIDFMPFKKV